MPHGGRSGGVRLSCQEQMLGDRPLGEKLGLIAETGFDGVDLGWATIADGTAAGTIAASGLPVAAVYA